MRRSLKVKVAAVRTPLRKATAVSAVVIAAPRRAFPAWIENGERGVALSATAVTSRVRDGLVLRVVGLKKSTHARNPSHGSGAR